MSLVTRVDFEGLPSVALSEAALCRHHWLGCRCIPGRTYYHVVLTAIYFHNKQLCKKDVVIVEFIGVPGSGKTTLKDRFAEHLARNSGEAVVISSRSVPRRARLFQYPFVCWKRRRAIGLAYKSLRRTDRPRSEKLFALRRLVVTLWLYDRERSTRSGILVMDEGYLQMSHMLMHDAAGSVSDVMLRQFLAVGPQSDSVIHVQAEPEVILERLKTKNRGLPPRFERLPYPQRVQALKSGNILFDTIIRIIRQDGNYNTGVIEVMNHDLDRALEQIITEYGRHERH